MKTFKILLTDGRTHEIDAIGHTYEEETLVLHGDGMVVIAEFQKHFVMGVIAMPLTVVHRL